MCIMYLFIYLSLFIGIAVGGLILLTNIWRELDMYILRELLKSQIKIKQIKNNFSEIGSKAF